MGSQFFGFILDIIFPPVCSGCGMSIKSHSYPLCNACSAGIPIHQSLFCPVHKRRIPECKIVCGTSSPVFALGAVSDFDNKPVYNLIHFLKYKNGQFGAVPCGKLMAKYFDKVMENTDIFSGENITIIPMPLHRKKYLRRGYNQTELIAREFIKMTVYSKQMTIENRALFRVRHSMSQTECKTGAERKENVRGCFSVKCPEKINGKNIILIDDVFTTGGTIMESAGELKRNGAEKILALVFAKTQ
jgi:ComF family protein